MISVVNLKKYFSNFVSSFRPRFTPISSFKCNGREYIIEGKEPGGLSRDHNYYFRVETDDEERVRQVFLSLGIQNFMSRDKRVKSNRLSTFKIDKTRYEVLSEFLGTIAPPHFSSPNSSKINEENIFKGYERDVLGIPQTTYVSETQEIPPELKQWKLLKRSKRSFVDLTKKS